MATNLAANMILELKFFTKKGVQSGINVRHYNVNSVAGGAMTDQQLCDAMSTTAAPLYKNYLTNGASYTGLRTQIISPLPVAAAVISTNGAGGGTIAGEDLPTAATLLLSLRTNLAGRANRGRVYLPFWSETHNSATGSPTAAAITLATNWANGLIATLNVVVGGVTVNISPVVWQRGPRTSTFVQSTVIRTEWATQRRRSLINRPDTLGP